MINKKPIALGTKTEKSTKFPPRRNNLPRHITVKHCRISLTLRAGVLFWWHHKLFLTARGKYSSRPIRTVSRELRNRWRTWSSGSRWIPKKRSPTIPAKTLQLILISAMRITWGFSHVRVWLFLTVDTPSRTKHTSSLHITLSTEFTAACWFRILSKKISIRIQRQPCKMMCAWRVVEWMKLMVTGHFEDCSLWVV